MGTICFRGCSKLEYVIIGSNCAKIDTGCFSGCSALNYIKIYSNTPPTIGTNVFSGSTCYIYVPDDYIEIYKSATNWSSIQSRIKSLSTFVEP